MQFWTYEIFNLITEKIGNKKKGDLNSKKIDLCNFYRNPYFGFLFCRNAAEPSCTSFDIAQTV